MPSAPALAPPGGFRAELPGRGLCSRCGCLAVAQRSAGPLAAVGGWVEHQQVVETQERSWGLQNNTCRSKESERGPKRARTIPTRLAAAAKSAC